MAASEAPASPITAPPARSKTAAASFSATMPSASSCSAIPTPSPTAAPSPSEPALPSVSTSPVSAAAIPSSTPERSTSARARPAFSQRHRHGFQLGHDQCRDRLRRDRILRLRRNVLTLGPGSVINGLVLGTGVDTFQLGGTGKDTFNLSLIGAGQQYDGFSTFNKVDSSNWTVTGTGAQDWNVLGGTLAVNGAINGLVTVNAGGTLGGTGTIDNAVVNGGCSRRAIRSARSTWQTA